MAKNQTIQHKRSSVSGNKPSAAQVSRGELALNFADKSIYTQNATGAIIELARDIVKSATPPSSPTSGDLWWDTTTTELRYYDGVRWSNIIYTGEPVLPVNTTVPAGTTGTGTAFDPYLVSATVTTGGSTTLGPFIVTGLTSRQFVPIVDLDGAANGGRFIVSNTIADTNGTLVFTIRVNDTPASSPGNYTARLKIGTGTAYMNITAGIQPATPSFPQTLNSPTGIAAASTVWTAGFTQLTSNGSLRLSTNGTTFNTGPWSINTGGTIYLKWDGAPGTNLGIDGAHGTTITGSVMTSLVETSSHSLVIDKTPILSFAAQTGVALSAAITSETVTITGVNSYVYLTSSNTITVSIDGASFVSVPSTGTTLRVTIGQTIAIRQTSSASNNATTTVTLRAGGTMATLATFSVTTGDNTINTPTILTPINNSTGMSTTPPITASPFGFTGQTRTHLNSDWQISTVSNFLSGIVAQSMASTTNLTSWSPGGLSGNTSYWVRVKYRSSSPTVESSWSSPVKFTTT